MKHILSAYIFLTIAGPWRVSAQPQSPPPITMAQPTIRHYTVENGLDINLTDGMLQDSNGFIWLDNNISLARFDGYTFKTYRHRNEDSLMQIGPDIIGRIMPDQANNLWVNNYDVSGANALVGNRKLLRYDPQKDGFIEYKPEIKSYIRQMTMDNDRTLLWLATGDGLYSYNFQTHETIPHPNTNDTLNRQVERIGMVEANNRIRRVVEKGSYLELYTFNGLWLFDKGSKSFRRPAVDSDPLLFNSGLLLSGGNWIVNWDQWIAMEVDSNYKVTKMIGLPEALRMNKEDFSLSWEKETPGHFLFTSEKHLVRFNGISGVIDTATSNILPGIRWKDRNNNIWTFRDGATQHISPEIEYSVINPAHDFAHDYAIRGHNKTSIVLISRSNQISISTSKSGSLDFRPIRFAGQQEKWSNFNYAYLGKEYFWIATWGRGVVGIPINRENATLETEGVLFYDHESDNPYTLGGNTAWGGIYEDPNGYVWTGTYNFGLNRINLKIPYGTEGSVDKFLHNPVDTSSISSNIVEALVPGDNGAIWIGTPIGVDLLKDGKFYHRLKGPSINCLFRSTSGDVYAGSLEGLYVARQSEDHRQFNRLNSIIVFEIYEDSLKRFWMSTPKGLVMYDPVRNLTIDLSDQGHLKYTGSIFDFADGTIGYFSETGKTIARFHPLDFRHDTSSTHPMLTSIEVNNRGVTVVGHPAEKDAFAIPMDISVLDKLELDYQHNNFSITFSAMEMTAPEKNLYKHMLEGYDPDWIETNYRNRTATYTSLPNGTYTFRVKASNHHGVWSENERTLKVKILPPPWRTWWAYAGYSMLVAGLLVWARRNIVRQERLKSSLQLEHVELEKAKEVDRVKTSFFTNISHEFRTPLTLIKGPVDTLLDRYKDDPEAVSRLKLVQRNSDLLLKLINQLLDLAKLESGTLRVEKSEGDVYSFVRAIAGSFESMARQKGVDLKIDVPDGPAPALFDKDKLETILINLVNNAIKFTPAAGTVKVRVDLTPGPSPLAERGAPEINSGEPVKRLQGNRDGTPSHSIRLTVSDTGIGIPVDQQSRIFERFHQVSETHKEVGTGIGLALVKELVALLGGTISVASEPGKGSEFVVVLPVETLAESVASAEVSDVRHKYQDARPENQESEIRNQESKSELSKADSTILVVEDNTDLRKFIIDSLGPNYNYLEAPDGVQGKETAFSESPDLIISDVMMPGMDGITMTGKLKADPRTSHIPIILLTAKSSEDSKLSGLGTGADDYLTKPFNRQELGLKVRNAIEVRRKITEKVRKELLSESPKLGVLSADEQFLLKVKEAILARLGDEQLSVESLAEEIGLSRVQLYRKVTALTGVSVNELIRSFRLKKAAELLKAKWGPVSQVAYEVGISNLSYFSKVFKEEFGVLPSEYS